MCESSREESPQPAAAEDHKVDRREFLVRASLVPGGALQDVKVSPLRDGGTKLRWWTRAAC